MCIQRTLNLGNIAINNQHFVNTVKMGKVSHADKMRMQTLREQGCGAKAIILAYPYKEWKLSTVQKICRHIDTIGYAAECKAGCGRPKSVRTAPNIDRVDELICSQEGATETHRSTRQIAAEINISERSVRRIAREDLHLTFFRRVPAQIITDAMRQKRQERANALLHQFKVRDTKRILWTLNT